MFTGWSQGPFNAFPQLANPLQLINSPPPTLYTTFGAQPVFGAPGYPAQMPTQAFSATTFAANPYAPPTASTSQDSNTPASAIPNQPQPFVMPLGPPPMAAPPTYTVYPPPRYPATSYYQYPTSTAGFYAATPTQNPSQPTSTPTNPATTTPPTNPTNPPAATSTNPATTTPTMTNTSVPTNQSTGTPTQTPANPWPTGYNQVWEVSDDAPVPCTHATRRANGQKTRSRALNN